MKKAILLIIAALIQPLHAAKRVPLQIETETITLTSRGDLADVYYPIKDNKKLPVVAVLQGALVSKEHYTGFGNALSRYGFIVVIPNHEQELVLGPPNTPPISVSFPDQQVINDVLEQMKLENENPDSILFERINIKHMGVVGHSVGGTAGLLAVDGDCRIPFCFIGHYEKPEELKVGAFYGTNMCNVDGGEMDQGCVSPQNNQGNILDVNTEGFPVLMVQGSLDGISTPQKGLSTFDLLNEPKKMVTINGANHYGITEINNPPGARPDSIIPTLEQEKSIKRIAKSIGRFFKKHLKFQLSFSEKRNRKNSKPLENETVSRHLFAFLTPLRERDIKRVSFYINGKLVNTEDNPPYELKGRERVRYSRFNTRRLSNGSHVLAAEIMFRSGGTQVVSSEFNVLNELRNRRVQR